VPRCGGSDHDGATSSWFRGRFVRGGKLVLIVDDDLAATLEV
jgi:hypothetical protein